MYFCSASVNNTVSWPELHLLGACTHHAPLTAGLQLYATYCYESFAVNVWMRKGEPRLLSGCMGPPAALCCFCKFCTKHTMRAALSTQTARRQASAGQDRHQGLPHVYARLAAGACW